jgi:hypothetical protein
MSLVTNLQNAFTRITTELKAHKLLINGNAADLSGLSTTAKSSLVAAVNEVNAKSGGVTINDTADSSTTTNSSTKIASRISTAVSNLVNASPTTLDTLKELADAIGDDPNYATTVATALGNRVRFDAAQALTAGQQTQAQANLVVYSQAQIGDPTTDFVATSITPNLT